MKLDQNQSKIESNESIKTETDKIDKIDPNLKI